MIKHVVMWQLKEEAAGNNKSENVNKMKLLLEELQDKIEEIQDLEVGVNFNPSEAAYDVVLYSKFDSKDDLGNYQNHPEHLKAAEFVKKVVAERVVVDYKI